MVRPGHRARDEGENLAPLVVEAERARCTMKSDSTEVIEQGVYGRRPGTGRAAHGVSDANDPAAHVAAFQR